jgi:predicted patatin/cPLA2 family phospholipase
MKVNLDYGLEGNDDTSNLKLIFHYLFVLVLLIMLGCTGAPKRSSVPAELTNEAQIPGVPDARSWADEWPKFSIEIFSTFTDEQFREHFPAIYEQPNNYLAISGGGDKGAYGAGLLYGWTQTGTRPEFSMVTGISTGALTAPFAFLGSDYDETLKKIYTTTSTKDIIKKRGIIKGLFSNSLADTKPLKETIAKYITPEIINLIGEEHKKGRRLIIGTLNLDAGRSVIWNIGAIANSNHPEKVTLIREILRASAAIPIAFPPIKIQVEADGKLYNELHVDGGTGSQVFVYPADMNWRAVMEKLKVPGIPNVYVLRNSFIDPNNSAVDEEILPIAVKTIDSLIRTQGIGDLYQIYTLCRRDGNTFNLAYIPSSFDEVPAEEFDPVYMSKLFELGRARAASGYPWQKTPPGLVLTAE